MDSNKFHQDQKSGTLPYNDRDMWLEQLQRQFSADLEQKSEVFYNPNPHVDGCSSESEEEVSMCHPNRNSSSFFTPCSGALPKRRKSSSVDDRLDDLFRIIKLHSHQLNLLQNQIKSLVDVIQQSCKTDLRGVVLQKNVESYPTGNDDVGEVGDLRKLCGGSSSDSVHEYQTSDSDIMPRCVFDPDLIANSNQSEHNFFSTVMGTLRGMLEDRESGESNRSNFHMGDSVMDNNVDKSMLNATIEQLKKLGVSFIDKVPDQNQKKVTFVESNVTRTESSVEIDSLARKYLLSRSDPRKIDAALDQISVMQKKTTDLSLATMKYLDRYKLSSKGSDERTATSVPKKSNPDVKEQFKPREDTRVNGKTSPIPGKILDSIAIRSQPKLSPIKQWLLKKN